MSVRSPVPKENVSFSELDTPEMVTSFPALSAEAAESKTSASFSGLPAWDTFLTTSATFAAFQVSVVVLAFLPVCSAVEDTLTVAFPLPCEGFTFNQFAFAIYLSFKKLKLPIPHWTPHHKRCLSRPLSIAPLPG